MSRAPSSRYHIEPLNSSHDRATFECGAPELDHYFHHQAGQDSRRKVAAVFVLVDAGGSVKGYYTLSAYSVHLGQLPEAMARKLPRYPLLPATLLGRLAVDQSCRGQKLGALLLVDALRRSWRNTSEVASVGVVVEALDDAARAFYRHHEFIPLAEHANKLFIAMGTIERTFHTL